MATAPDVATPAPRELRIVRLIDAPRALVFKAWTDPAWLARWWGPRAHPAVQMTMDVRPGGVWRGLLRGVEDGRELRHGGVFREVTPPERLVFTFAWEEEGERGLETLVTVTFAEHEGKTRMVFHQAPFQSIAERDGHRGGWSSAFDRLDEQAANF